jgi:UDP-glucose 6-dehydrogenase
LYILGIRVAELKEITISQIYEYLDKHAMEITVVKSTLPVKMTTVVKSTLPVKMTTVVKSTLPVKMTYVSSEESRNLIKKYVENFIIKKFFLLEDLETIDHIYGRGAYLVTLSREHLTRRINMYFKN